MMKLEPHAFYYPNLTVSDEVDEALSDMEARLDAFSVIIYGLLPSVDCVDVLAAPVDLLTLKGSR